MSKIKNTNQTVKNSYYTNFITVFGNEPEKTSVTGKYVIDDKNGKLIKIDKNIPKLVKDKMEPLTSSISHIDPINVQKKEVPDAD